MNYACKRIVKPTLPNHYLFINTKPLFSIYKFYNKKLNLFNVYSEEIDNQYDCVNFTGIFQAMPRPAIK